MIFPTFLVIFGLVLGLSACTTPLRHPCVITGVTIELDDAIVNQSKCGDAHYNDNGQFIMPPSYARGCAKVFDKRLIIMDAASNWSHEMGHLLEAYCR